jgi:hypothetical protein
MHAAKKGIQPLTTFTTPDPSTKAHYICRCVRETAPMHTWIVEGHIIEADDGRVDGI